MSHKLNIHIQSIFFFCKICFWCIFSFFFFLREGIDGGDKWYANLFKEEQIMKKCGNKGT